MHESFDVTLNISTSDTSASYVELEFYGSENQYQIQLYPFFVRSHPIYGGTRLAHVRLTRSRMRNAVAAGATVSSRISFISLTVFNSSGSALAGSTTIYGVFRGSGFIQEIKV